MFFSVLQKAIVLADIVARILLVAFYMDCKISHVLILKQLHLSKATSHSITCFV